MPRFSIIVASSLNGVIGKDGKMPWHLPPDLKRFKKITMGHPILMGRKTFESIGKPLPGRTNIVLTSNHDNLPQNTLPLGSKNEVFERFTNDVEVFVIGGGTLYSMYLPIAEKVYLTEIQNIIEGDTYFKFHNKQDFQLIHEEEGEFVGMRYKFLNYNRASANSVINNSN